MIRAIFNILLSLIVAIFPSLKDFIDIDTIVDNLEFVTMAETDNFNIVLKDKNGNTVYDNTFSPPVKNDEEPVPPSYDAREDGIVTGVKHQASTGACWAFAAISAAETSAVKKDIVTLQDADYSEAHLTWFGLQSLTDNTDDPTYGDGIFCDSPYTDGGNWVRSVFALARWSGAEKEENAPFNGFPEAMGNYGEAARYNSYAHLQNSQFIPADDSQGIKKAILKNGSVTVSYYHSASFLNYTESGTTYFQDRVENTNHTVTIIGWDDNFSKDNFRYKPVTDGAWLVKNSWGENWGDNGYFWVSYCDTSLSCFVTYDMESADNYDNNRQYDGFGYKGWAYLTGEESMSMANVFTPDSLEQLNAVSFHTVQDNADYKISIYTDLTDSGIPTDGKLRSVQSGHLDYRGYYTIKLDNPVTLKQGSKFSVVVTITVPEGYNACIPLEFPEGFDGAHNRSYHGEEGQSFFTVGEDYSQWTDSVKEGYNNVCIKAFTDEMKLSLKSSSQLSISLGYLAGVRLNMKTDFILNQFHNKNAVYEDGTVYLYDEIGRLLDSIEISFYADIDENGEVNADDYELLRLMINAEIYYDDKEATSADLNFDKKITKADLDLLLQEIKNNI